MRILLVEDSERLQRAVSLGLRDEGFVVDVASDGRDALWRASSIAYDAIVLDIMLPSLDGMAVLERLRKDGNPTHILMLTARADVADRVRGLQAGADDYLVKPFSFEELLARVQSLCRRTYAQKSQELRINDLTLNLATRELFVRGRQVELSPGEFRLLQLLLLRRGEVVSRTEIEAHLYDEEAEIMSNTVNSKVSLLRKKLTAAGEGPLIETRRGFGYIVP